MIIIFFLTYLKVYFIIIIKNILLLYNEINKRQIKRKICLLFLFKITYTTNNINRIENSFSLFSFFIYKSIIRQLVILIMIIYNIDKKGEKMLIKIEEQINKLQKIYAHTKAQKQSETLKEHLDRTIKYYQKISDKKEIDKHIKKLIEKTFSNERINKEEKEYIYKLFINAIYLHDLGKINPKFQKDKMKNDKYKNIETCTSEHSLISSFIYIDIFSESAKQFRNTRLIKTIIYCFAYQIARHHSNLENLSAEEFLNKLEKVREEELYQEYKNKERLLEIDLLEENTFLEKNKILKQYQIQELEFFILNKLLYSLIITCDYYATHEYMNSEEVEIETLNNINSLIKKYKNTPVYQSIERYKKDNNILDPNNINRLRSDIFIEAEKTLIKNLDKKLFYLETPTGSGKTNTSINLALNILEKDKSINNIFYIFPFNTLIEQTKETFENIFEYEKDFICKNSSIAITEEQTEDIDYEKIYLDYNFMHYPVILTSHVNLFSALFGTKKENNLILSRFSNSVIIIDEIQAYKNSIWKEMINFLNKYSEILNIKIIIMSATLPKLDNLINEDKQIVDLIENKGKYFNNPIFQNRVQIDTKYLKKKINLETLADIVKERESKQEKLLIEFIKKKDAREFYKLLKSKKIAKEIVEISGDDNRYIRKQILEKIKDSNDIIVVCTQVIEAGVDIDMDNGFKNISLIESEEQFLGRINRSCKKRDCKAYFFDYTVASEIYRNDIRNGYNIKDDKYKNMLQEKEFEQYYQEVIKEINKKGEEYNQNNFDKFLENARNLQFEEIDNKMKLINQINLQIFLNRTITIAHREITGSEIWKEYKETCLNNELSYAQRKIKISQIEETMDLFMYSITIYDKNNCKKYFTEEFGDILYIENGEDFIEDGKFNKEKYDEMCGGIFW